jgi:hypothetical protein
MTTAVIGEEGYRWFIGVVEDREDPKKLGRLRVRIYNVHPFTPDGQPDIVNVPTEHLPWAMPINSIMSAGIVGSIKDGVGISPTGIMVGTTVVGWFADGNECQIPLVMGTIAGLVGKDEANELPKPAIEENSVGALKNKTKIKAAPPFKGEPDSPYAAKYPHNKVMRTETGHLIEIDDTPSKERIHVMHRTGTYIEVDKDGNITIKTVKDTTDVTTGNEDKYVGKNVNEYVGGNVNVRIKGNVSVLVDGTYTLESKGRMLLKAPRIDLNP